jgi:hypothetical protein
MAFNACFCVYICIMNGMLPFVTDLLALFTSLVDIYLFGPLVPKIISYMFFSCCMRMYAYGTFVDHNQYDCCMLLTS